MSCRYRRTRGPHYEQEEICEMQFAESYAACDVQVIVAVVAIESSPCGRARNLHAPRIGHHS